MQDISPIARSHLQSPLCYVRVSQSQVLRIRVTGEAHLEG